MVDMISRPLSLPTQAPHSISPLNLNSKAHDPNNNLLPGHSKGQALLRPAPAVLEPTLRDSGADDPGGERRVPVLLAREGACT